MTTTTHCDTCGRKLTAAEIDTIAQTACCPRHETQCPDCAAKTGCADVTVESILTSWRSLDRRPTRRR